MKIVRSLSCFLGICSFLTPAFSAPRKPPCVNYLHLLRSAERLFPSQNERILNPINFLESVDIPVEHFLEERLPVMNIHGLMTIDLVVRIFALDDVRMNMVRLEMRPGIPLSLSHRVASLIPVEWLTRAHQASESGFLTRDDIAFLAAGWNTLGVETQNAIEASWQPEFDRHWADFSRWRERALTLTLHPTEANEGYHRRPWGKALKQIAPLIDDTYADYATYFLAEDANDVATVRIISSEEVSIGYFKNGRLIREEILEPDTATKIPSVDRMISFLSRDGLISPANTHPARHLRGTMIPMSDKAFLGLAIPRPVSFDSPLAIRSPTPGREFDEIRKLVYEKNEVGNYTIKRAVNAHVFPKAMLAMLSFFYDPSYPTEFNLDHRVNFTFNDLVSLHAPWGMHSFGRPTKFWLDTEWTALKASGRDIRKKIPDLIKKVRDPFQRELMRQHLWLFLGR